MHEKHSKAREANSLREFLDEAREKVVGWPEWQKSNYYTASDTKGSSTPLPVSPSPNKAESFSQ